MCSWGRTRTPSRHLLISWPFTCYCSCRLGPLASLLCPLLRFRYYTFPNSVLIPPTELPTLNLTTYCNGHNRIVGKEAWFLHQTTWVEIPLHHLQVSQLTVASKWPGETWPPPCCPQEMAVPCSGCSSYKCCSHSQLFSFFHTLHLIHQQILLALLSQ